MRRLAFLVLALMALAACQPQATPALPVTPSPTFDPFDANATPPPEILRAADAEYLLLQSLYTRSLPSVVGVTAFSADGDSLRGSGFIVDRNGRIVTNAHLLVDAERIIVSFSDGYTTDATLLGADSYSDVAALAVDVAAERSVPLVFGDSDAVQVGERAVLLGNAWGMNNALTTGIIGGIGRGMSSAMLIDAGLNAGFQNPRILQINVGIPPEGSGSPVLNSAGEVIGLATEITTLTGLYQGLGFAVPSNTLARVVPELIRDGEVHYAWLGVNTVQSQYGLMPFVEPLKLSAEQGILVTQVTPGSPAADAGIRGGTQEIDVNGVPVCAGGDIIVAVDDVYVAHINDLVYYLLIQAVPGDVVELLLVRDGATRRVPVTLVERPASNDIIPPCGE